MKENNLIILTTLVVIGLTTFMIAGMFVLSTPPHPEPTPIVKPPVDKTPFIKIYGYGDSTVRDRGNFIVRAAGHYNASVSTYIKGGGFISSQGVQHKDEIIQADVVIYTYTNDFTANSKEEFTSNYIELYNYIKSRNMTPVPCIPFIQKRWNDIDYKEYIRYAETKLTAQNIKFVKLYDAVDSTPGNGVPDNYVDDYYWDTIHPNDLGNEKIGKYLADHIEPEMVVTDSENTHGITNFWK